MNPPPLPVQPDAVALGLPADSGEAALRALHARLAPLPGVLDAAGFLRDLLERAALSSVCLSADVAMPHARTAAVARLMFAAGRARAPVSFDAQHPAVRLVFLIGTPKNLVTEYLQLVAGLVRLLKDEALRAELLNAPTEADFRAALERGVRK